MILFFSFYFILIGVVLGSFVTALVYRQRFGWSMWEKHSKCPNCKHDLAPKDLIPIVSYLVLRGRCRYCGKTIGRQYVWTELASAGLFLYVFNFLYWRIMSAEAFEWWWVLSCIVFVSVISVLALAMTVYDIRWGELPNKWTLGGASLALAMLALATIFDQPILWQPEVSGFVNSWWSGLLSGVIALVLLVAIAYFSEIVLHKPGMGIGDAKLALLMGFFVGFPAIVVAMYIAFISGAVLSLLLIAGKRKSLGASLPFGPFMIVGMFLSLWISPTIVSWYSTFWL